MSIVGKIRVKALNELLDAKTIVHTKVCNEISTPQVNKRPSRNAQKAATIPRKTTGIQSDEDNPCEFISTKKVRRSVKKETPGQLRIDTFFKSSSKTFKVEVPLESIKSSKHGGKENKSSRKQNKKGRKRLFDETTTETETDNTDATPPITRSKANKKCTKLPKVPETPNQEKILIADVIDLCSDSEPDDPTYEPDDRLTTKKCDIPNTTLKTKSEITADLNQTNNSTINHATTAEETPKNSNILNNDSSVDQVENKNSASAPVSPPPVELPSGSRRKKPRPLPSYKVVDGTTFAVDAFQFGYINGVTHYFLSHFHADHYIGLTRKFAMPLYLSPITARLVRAFIPVDDAYLHILELNEPKVIAGVEVTAIDANHCPGALMFIFKLTTGRCILHTGDFRACSEMESEPIFWNNDIDTIYLDTTYISDKYAFCTQYESIDKAKLMINDFQNMHEGKRILYVCGSYVIGKEKFWAALAEEFQFKVWAEGTRKKSLDAMQIEEYLKYLCDNPQDADMHIIPIMKLNYATLVEYFTPYSRNFDILLAIRPSGWEKNSRPQYRGTINIIGIEYSEHSGYSELERFVTYLKPREVISTVPAGRDLRKTCVVPPKWYKYDKLLGKNKNFQTTITSYLRLETPTTKLFNRDSLNDEPLESTALDNSYNVSPDLVSMTPPTLNLPNHSDHSGANKQLEASSNFDLDADADDDWIS